MVDHAGSWKYSGVVSIVLASVCVGCTSIQVRPVEPDLGMSHVCISHNRKVQVENFVPVVREGLSRHGVTSEEFQDVAPSHCEFILTYTARRSWDMAPYLSYAEIWIQRDGEEVATGEFHLRGKGGYSFYKFEGTKKKIDPMIDRLFDPQ